jgi:hypothetical protein
MSNPFEEINEKLDRLEKLISQSLPKQEPVLKYHSRQETADILQVSLPTLNTYTVKGIVKGSKVGNRVLYSDEAIQEALKDATSYRYRRV